MNKYVQGRLPEKPIRPNIAGRLAKKSTKKQTNKHIHGVQPPPPKF